MYIIESYINYLEYKDFYEFANNMTDGYLNEISREELEKTYDKTFDNFHKYQNKYLDIRKSSGSVGELEKYRQLAIDEKNKLRQINKDLQNNNYTTDTVSNQFPVKPTQNSTPVKSTSVKSTPNTNSKSVTLQDIKDALVSGYETAFKFVKDNIKYIGISVLAITVSVIAYKIYRKYKDGECYGLSGDNYNRCKISAINSSMRVIKQTYDECSNSTDPENCRKKMRKLFYSWEEKKNKYRG